MLQKAAELYSRAADYYVQSGKVDKACSALNKGAKYGFFAVSRFSSV